MKVLVLLISLCFSTASLAWAKNGHRIVAQIAYEYLERSTKIKISNLIQNEHFANLSTWADEIKSEKRYDFARPFHYINIPKGKKASDIGGVHILSALKDFEQKLKSETVSRLEKIDALKFFIHLMGDLHNPLHIGYPEDLGGNRFPVRWFNKSTNLHHVWDEEMIEYQQLSYTEYANILIPIDSLYLSEWVKGDYEQWIDELLDIRGLIYPEKNESLRYSYHYKWHNLLNNQLRKAGLRLAYKLNAIFSH